MVYTIISGTNRTDSYTEKVAKSYQDKLKMKGIDAPIFSLQDMDVLHRNEEFIKREKASLIPTEKFIFIIPEYNGSYPGVLKALIDNTDIKKVWWGKKALLTGVSSGRAGNLRGMDHLVGVLQYLKMIVHPNKLPISIVETLFDETEVLNHTPTSDAIDAQLLEFIDL